MRNMSFWDESKENVFQVMHKDLCVASINRKNGEVKLFRKKLLPFNLWLEESEDFDERVNNLTNFNYWCSTRLLSLDRRYAKELLNSCGLTQAITDKERADIALQYRCVSLKDHYWVTQAGDIATWGSVSVFNNRLDEAIINVALKGKSITITNLDLVKSDLATDGVFPKAWLRKENFYLLKGDENDSVRKEVEASKILRLLGISVLDYKYKEMNQDRVSCCQCFTNDTVSYVTAGDLNNFLINEDVVFSEWIREYWISYCQMIVADFLVGNTDRHQDNWGFLYDDEKVIVSPVPLMDFNHAFEGDLDMRCLPEVLMGRNITQFEAVKEVLSLVELDLSNLKALQEFHYGSFVLERLKMLGLTE